jgi:peptide chain release factor 1
VSIEDKIEERARKAHELEAKLSDPAVAGDGRLVGRLSKELGALRPFVELHAAWAKARTDAAAGAAMAADPATDPEMRALALDEARAGAETATGLFERLKRLLVAEDEDAQRDHRRAPRGRRRRRGGAVRARPFEMYSRLAVRAGGSSRSSTAARPTSAA